MRIQVVQILRAAITAMLVHVQVHIIVTMVVAGVEVVAEAERVALDR